MSVASLEQLTAAISEDCGYINWRADEIKQAQVRIDAHNQTITATTAPDDPLFAAIAEDCGSINWRADEIKGAQVRIDANTRAIQALLGAAPPIEPPIEPPDITPPPIDPPGNISEAPRVGPANLHYLGAFRLPAGVPPGCAYGFDYALTSLAFNPQHQSLFINNHAYEQKTGEVTIPTPSLDPAHLPVATYLQHPHDITEGRLQCVLAGGGAYWDRCEMGDVLVYGEKVLGTSYIFYDGGHQAVLSHFYSNKLVSEAGDTVGLFDVGSIGAGFVAGHLCHVPPEWQAAIGGTALTGQSCLSIISRTSFGPSAFAFNPQDLVGMGQHETLPATPLVYYDEAHQNLGRWDQQTDVNHYFNMGTQIRGCAFITGSRSVLFFGVQGLGVPCYGESDLSAPPPPGLYDGHCYDPARSDKGCHAYPYQPWVWAYDANDLVKVKNGELQPWDVRPYEVWGLTFPVTTPGGQIQGIAYDPLAQRLYISQYNALYAYPGQNPYEKAPVIHVYQLQSTKRKGWLLSIEGRR
jgi:hypothetical protein